MIWFWRYLLGYLTIKIEGDNCEQMINSASAHGLSIWNLYYQNGCIYGNISIKNFLRIRSSEIRKNCKIKIVKKCGLVFKTRRYSNRIGFILGIGIFFSILFFLSNFVWIINIEGNDKISDQQVINICEDIGIYEGALKSKINSKYDAQRLQLIQKEISWCSLNIEGCVLSVNLSEATITDKADRETPSNLKASIAGKIKKINVATGNVPIKVGDVVSKGDILVSGIIENASSTVFVHSSGEIIAETKRVFSAEGDFSQLKNKETGNIITRYTVDVFSKKIPLYLGKIKKPHTYKREIKRLELFGKKIPIKIACEQYALTEKSQIIYDNETLEDMLYRDIKNQVDKFDFLAVKECDRECIPTAKGILLKITYICEENIAVQDKILLSKEN